MPVAIQALLGVAALVVVAAACYGWGHATRRLLRLPSPGAPATIALGVAAVVAVGGVLNLARVAYAPALWLLLAAGCYWFARVARSLPAAWRLLPEATDRSDRRDAALAAALIVAVVGIAIATQLPPAIFNHDDDLRKYFTHPLRMLATGTLAGGTMNALGSEALGGMALLHAFVLSVLPIGCINGVDAVFGLALLLAMSARLAWRRLAALPGAALAVICIAAIEPQYVNVSLLYLGAALVLACALLAAQAHGGPPALALGLLYGSMVALKPTFAFFAVLHLPLTAACVAAERASLRAGLAWGLQSGVAAAAAVAPWVLMYAPLYLNASWGAPVEVVPSGPPDGLDQLLSANPAPYGATFAHYSALAGLIVVVPLLALGSWRRVGPVERREIAAAAAIALAACGAWLYVIAVSAPELYGRVHALRYSVPLLLGAAPAALLLAAHGLRPLSGGAAAVALAMLVVAASFTPSLADRIQMAVQYRTIHAFLNRDSFTKRYGHFIEVLLQDFGQLRDAQLRVPAGETIVVWVAQPFALDYARNPIVDIEMAGLATRWARIPPGTRYLLWEHILWSDDELDAQSVYARGARERLSALRAKELMRKLRAETERGEVQMRDERFLLLRFQSDAR